MLFVAFGFAARNICPMVGIASQVRYSKGGHWVPSVPGLACASCGETFTGQRADQRTCSRACAAAYRRTLTPKKYKDCGHCRGPFEIPNGGGKSRAAAAQYCSRECARAANGWEKPLSRICGCCGKSFEVNAPKVRAGFGHYCSKKCYNKAAQLGKVSRRCAECGKRYKLSVSTDAKSGVVCSKACQKAYYKRDRSAGWKGGVIQQHDRPYRRIDREGYVGKYEGEHRLVVERAIGRKLVRNEVVVCIDGNHANLDPGNLFLLPDQREFGFLKVGAIPWPEKSNLEDWKVGGYVMPEVAVVVHEWEDGIRRSPDTGRKITRHPQADEIIARRKARASLRELAEAFGNSVSTMRETLDRRL